MGLVDNGRYFAQCASKHCNHRVWIKLTVEGKGSPAKEGKSAPAKIDAARGLVSMPQVGSEGDRWNRHKKFIPAEQQRNHSEPSGRLFVRRSVTGEFVHGREGVAQVGKHLLGAPDTKGVVRTPADIGQEEACGSGSCTPVTSGAEELLDEEEECHEPPPDLTRCFEKRWCRGTASQNNHVSAGCEGDEFGKATVALKLAIMELFPSASPILVDELLEEAMTLEQIAECLSTSEDDIVLA